MEIKDSGERRQFSSGAVRDANDSKGRCDLLPLGVVAEILNDKVLSHIDQYVRIGGTRFLIEAIKEFSKTYYDDLETAMLEVSFHYSEGLKKYPPRNWEKGIDLHSYIDSGVRHYLKHKRGDVDEPHDRAFIWNMLGAIHTHYYHPDLRDLPFNKTEEDIH